jgi:hypothetical protein
MEILGRYVLRGRPLIDEWRLWWNTHDEQDQQYIRQLQQRHPDFITIEDRGFTLDYHEGHRRFFEGCNDINTIYIKVDDDIVFIDEACIENLLSCRVRNPEPFVVFANTINNALNSHFLQQNFKLPTNWEQVAHTCMDFYGWKSPEFAKKLHEYFLSKDPSDFYMPDVELRERTSINFLAWFGEDFKKHFDFKWGDDEDYLSFQRPFELHRPTMICGDAVVSHFAYFTQRDLLDSTDILQRYAERAKNIRPKAQKRKPTML